MPPHPKTLTLNKNKTPATAPHNQNPPPGWGVLWQTTNPRGNGSRQPKPNTLTHLTNPRCAPRLAHRTPTHTLTTTSSLNRTYARHARSLPPVSSPLATTCRDHSRSRTPQIAPPRAAAHHNHLTLPLRLFRRGPLPLLQPVALRTTDGDKTFTENRTSSDQHHRT